MKNIIVFGAASGGKIIADAICKQKDKFNLLCFLDNNLKLWGKEVLGVKVLGGIELLPKLLDSNDVHEVIVAISNVGKEALSELSALCHLKNVDLRVIPDSLNIILGNPILNQLREVSIADLLGRKEVFIRNDLIDEKVLGRVVAVTGAAGSIGSEIVRQVCKFSPKTVIGIDLNENDLYLLELYISRHYPGIEFISSICSVQDYISLKSELEDVRPDIVFHCAAHKHVPLMERSPYQAVKNNVFGSYNVAKIAGECRVKRFVLISTDKAVNPKNIMGASKRLAELLILSMNKNEPSTLISTRYMVVRFGNVLGSAGSVVPIFKELLQEGKDLTVTDERMTRYFMTIPEAARLVIESGFVGDGGELFVLDMGKPVKIKDLAENMIALSGSDVSINYIGLRPGEKLYEELFYDKDNVIPTNNNKILLSKSEQDEDVSKENILNKLTQVLTHKYDAKNFLIEFVDSYNV